ncbi:Protoglobin-domain-containing protein [Obelidium mucronatum]|nr:Protoglobin-domain-containing protein [Obelidium mucronatum]
MAPATKITTVDRERLYTDLMYRFQYVSQFVGFDETDIKAIKAAAPLIAPLVPVIVDAVYDHLFSFDLTKEIFLQRGDGFHGHMPSNLNDLTLESEQIKFRKDFLGKYLVKLVTAEYDAKFVAYLDRVGKIHTTTPDKKSKINVEYIHCNALFGWLHGFLAETVDSLPQLQGGPEVTAARAKTLAAFSKLLWIQNDFFAMYYLRDSEVFRGNKPAPTSVLKSVGFSSERGLFTVLAVSAVAAFAAWQFKK